MAPPSQLAIATGSVLRLLKEEISYHKELVDQEAKVQILDEKIKSGHGDQDGNDEFMLKQQQTAVDQTKAVFGPLKEKISAAVAKLEDQIDQGEQGGASATELEQAKIVLAQAKTDQNGTS